MVSKSYLVSLISTNSIKSNQLFCRLVGSIVASVLSWILQVARSLFLRCLLCNFLVTVSIVAVAAAAIAVAILVVV